MTASLEKPGDAVGFFIECGKCQVLMRPWWERPSVCRCPTCGHQVMIRKVRLYSEEEIQRLLRAIHRH
ncbi:MAG: hypothetical protein ACETV0_05880 [Nitrososphaeria archaeon]